MNRAVYHDAVYRLHRLSLLSNNNNTASAHYFDRAVYWRRAATGRILVAHFHFDILGSWYWLTWVVDYYWLFCGLQASNLSRNSLPHSHEITFAYTFHLVENGLDYRKNTTTLLHSSRCTGSLAGDIRFGIRTKVHISAFSLAIIWVNFVSYFDVTSFKYLAVPSRTTAKLVWFSSFHCVSIYFTTLVISLAS